MKLTTLRTDAGLRLGVADGDAVRVLPTPETLLQVIRGGQEALDDVARRARGAEALPLAEAQFAPLLEPPTIRDYLTFENHIAVLMSKDAADGAIPEGWYAEPGFYFSNPVAVVAPYDPVPVPPGSQRFDYELEIAAVVGRAGSDLTPAQAREHIVGFTVMNDWSARDLQRRELTLPLGPSKSKDAATTLGPWLVTADEFADVWDDEGTLSLTTEVRLNGGRTGGDTTANMSWTFPELLAYASRGTVVRPGDVLGSGTCGTGCLAELWVSSPDTAPGPLTPGDTVRIAIERIGHIENRIVPGAAPVSLPPARSRRTSRIRSTS
ncbi:fumarylacetoacetate hydrolase family protein [Streptomyces sp. R35]|uniref:Fumarylacetoacetate hydrolase family protein n=1 Tax=Streptomyces sp. R35 TaxID=3238630 RepID=A0AB39SKU7_9ACTN